MHELDLTQSMISQINENADQNGIAYISRIHLVLGKLSGVDMDALRAVFDLFKVELRFKNAVLEIEEREIIGRCNDCLKEFTIYQYLFICPHCQGNNIEIIQGRELFVDYYEGD